MPRMANVMKRLAASSSLLAGLVLFGQGAYIHAKALLAQVLLERAFAETIATGRAVKPWSWADTWPVARIEVKRLNASTIVLAGSSGQALAFGPGHVELTPRCRRARHRGLFGAPRHAFPLPQGCRDRRRDRGHAPRRQDDPLSRRPRRGRAFRRLGPRSADRRLRAGAVDLLAVRRRDAGADALSAARDDDRRRAHEIARRSENRSAPCCVRSPLLGTRPHDPCRRHCPRRRLFRFRRLQGRSRAPRRDPDREPESGAQGRPCALSLK